MIPVPAFQKSRFKRFASLLPAASMAALLSFGCISSQSGTVRPEPRPDTLRTSIASDSIAATYPVSAGLSTVAPDTMQADSLATETHDPYQLGDRSVQGRILLPDDSTDSPLHIPLENVANGGKAISDTSAPDNSRPLPSKSAAIDTLAPDTLRAPVEKKKESDLDTSIVYGAEHVDFDVIKRVSILREKAKILYKDMTLNAYQIKVDWQNMLMTATPGFDTTWTDSSMTEVDTIQVIGVPTFSQGSQTMTGDLMRVNMETKEGYIEGGITDYGEGFYGGDQIQKVSDKVLYVQDGSYTSCDAKEPHFQFTGSKMKMIYRDKVVGKPVVLRFGDVPVAMIPFAVFSTKSGRRSGIVIPTVGENKRQGRHLKNIGYYWAASDYWDLKTTMDYYEKTGVLFRGDFVYNARYKMQGGISGSFNNQSTTRDAPKSTQWDLRIKHNQDIDQYTKLRIDGTYASSGSYYNDLSNNVNRRLDQKLRSNATLTKRWPTSGASMSMNLSHQQNLQTDENNQTLPNVSFRAPQWQPFPDKKNRKKKKKDPNLIYEPPKERRQPGEKRARRDDDDRWYNSIKLTYNSNLKNERKEKLKSSGSPELGMEEEYRSGMTHNVSLVAPQKVFRYITVNPSVRYREDWFIERENWYIGDDKAFQSNKEKGFFQRRTMNASLTANTKFFGYFHTNIGNIRTFRHVVTPNVSLNFRPDFEDKEWGYYQHLDRTFEEEDEDGNSITTVVSDNRDRYNGSLLGGTSRGKQLTVNGGLNNIFQMKSVEVDDKGEEKEIKTDLFTYNISGFSYNLASDSLRFGDIRASFRASPIKGKNRIGPLERLSVDFSTTHSMYQYDIEANRKVDKFYWDRDDINGLNVLRMTNFSANASFSLSGANPFLRQQPSINDPLETATEDTLGTEEDLDDVRNEFDDRFRDDRVRMRKLSSGRPWSVSGSLRYTLNMNNPMKPNESIRTNGNFTLKLTKNWQIRYSTTLDLHDRDIVASNLSITRDLHCWQGSFTWSPRGIGQGFYLNIGIKTAQLRDIKIEQRRGSGTFNL